ncbi:16S rRNA (guanine(527)-N(7))-methyltransferase RsmG [Cutibacterium sp.]|uniref:16S rRNA (guanine(527)-N(7))-methyltransferase RsmG n=1 Tax=Cutibacterium sp. TaxID=1912221 RepID=UPI0026DCD6D5|nr:16S rRNA (guanine(527)-N(7))-methyltransferase RsmG [Cutibacterium sp.]MDO4412560.1 16S rRNA (guanine(527)-N(7))-methyltransferase RsmG [Cutibacterium sp.]
MTEATDDVIAERLYGNRYKTIKQYVDILANRGVEWGLVGPREVDRLWERHILNSAALESLIPEGSTVVDVGSGAGLPGIPLAVLRPDLEITLVEPMLRRANFLMETVQELDLGARVAVLRGRAEDVGIVTDVVVCRAVAKLTTLVGWTVRLFGQTGCLLALKGQSADEEVRKAKKELAKHHLCAEVLLVRADPSSEVTHAVRVRRCDTV